MKTKSKISLSLMALGLCSLAFAEDYKSPEVEFKKRGVPSKEMKSAEFGDHYKVEAGTYTDRQIASEEESDRNPSSVVAADKKKPAYEPAEGDDKHEAETPQPWLYRGEARKK
jgi:hypothetical protein